MSLLKKVTFVLALTVLLTGLTVAGSTLTSLWHARDKKIVLVKINQGLGTQLFRYAAAYNLAKKTGREIWLIGTYRDFVDLKKYKRPPTIKQYHITYQRQIPFFDLSHFFLSKKVVNSGNFFEAFGDPSQILYVSRQYQSEIYFKECRDELLKQFSVKKVDPDLKEKKEWIRSFPNSIAVHIRNGDFERFKGALLPLSYSFNEMKGFMERYENPTFFIFSDNPKGVRTAFANLQNVHVLDNKKNDPLFDFELMRTCDHIITANSMFSWWAAWLNENPNKRVIAPFPRMCHGEDIPFMVPSSEEQLVYPEEWTLVNPFSFGVIVK
jgi:hypothetical protein